MQQDREVIMRKVTSSTTIPEKTGFPGLYPGRPAQLSDLVFFKVLPPLQKFCKDRGVVLSVVDLRWGITTEQSNQGQTINICLKEIDR